MSFLGGAECSTAGNPLSQFTKHVQDDKSLQRDRLVGRGPGGAEGFRSGGKVGWQDHSMDTFLQDPGQLAQSDASPFAMEQMRRELEKFQAHAGPPRAHTGSPGWAAEFGPQLGDQARMEAAFKAQGHGSAGFSPADFARYQQIGRAGSERTASPMLQNGSTVSGLQRPMGMGYGSSMGMGMGGMGMGMGGVGRMGQFGSSFQQRPAQEGKGKARLVELDEHNWEEQFAQLDAEGQSKDLDAEARAAMEQELDDMDRSVLSETDAYGDFESVWRGIQAERADARGLAAEDEGGFMNESLGLGDLNPWDNFDDLGTHGAMRDAPEGDYLFEEENLFTDVGDPFGEGMNIMRNGGNLSLAALAFEAAVQKDPSHVEAWTALGGAQAQNEKESPAIRALERALKLDPTNLPALMGLAVSYTNEGYESTAFRTLERWLATKYPEIVDPADVSRDADFGFTDRAQLHERVTELFIRAAQLSPGGEQMDPDVQVGLGVLFYGAEAYEKAVDCFQSALASTEAGASTERSQLHLLWNRLGATLANSGRSEEAIAAYEKALTLRPNFVRARYNLGVSCINIGCLGEAAQHLLGALAMHAVVEAEGRERAREVTGGRLSDSEIDGVLAQNQSTNLYDTLRRVFSQMDRRDLAELVVPGVDVQVFRREFDF
ncbi:MAG: Peroxisomal membrane signal receptor PTS1 [Thelocarpon impressellum]|nr:MAG: Peroxisomal membrane signal receptor PTS1 [Thelocarpon impressellum]